MKIFLLAFAFIAMAFAFLRKDVEQEDDSRNDENANTFPRHRELKTFPTSPPTLLPTKLPTKLPTLPTQPPTRSPTQLPTKLPTRLPTELPTKSPTKLPTQLPTKLPTQLPTRLPTKLPTLLPTKLPTNLPSQSPTSSPVVIVRTETELRAALSRNYDPIYIGVAQMIISNEIPITTPVEIIGFPTLFVMATTFQISTQVKFKNINFQFSNPLIHLLELESMVNFTGTTSSFSFQNSCPTTNFNASISSNCFQVIDKVLLNWEDASRYCQENFEGGNLLSIHSVAENLISKYDIDFWLGGYETNHSFEWSDSSESSWIASLVDDGATSNTCVATKYFKVHSADCMELKPFICSIPRPNPANFVITTSSNNNTSSSSQVNFVNVVPVLKVKNYLQVQDVLRNGGFPSGTINVGNQYTIDGKYPQVVSISIDSSGSDDSVIASFDSTITQFSSSSINTPPSLVHLFSSSDSCIRSVSLLFDGKTVAKVDISEFFPPRGYPCRSLPFEIYDFKNDCLMLDQDLTIDFTKGSNCDALNLIWRNPLIGEPFYLKTTTYQQGDAPITIEHHGELGTRVFQVSPSKSLPLLDLIDVRTLPDEVIISSRDHVACVANLGVSRYGNTIRLANLANLDYCSQFCGAYSTSRCFYFDDSQYLASADVNLLPTNNNYPPSSCSSVVDKISFNAETLYCGNEVNVTVFEQFKFALQNVPSFVNVLYINVLVTNLVLLRDLYIPSFLTVYLTCLNDCRITGSEIHVGFRSTFKITNVGIGFQIDMHDAFFSKLEITSCSMIGFPLEVEDGFFSTIEASKNSLFVSTFNHLSAGVKNLFLQDQGTIFVENTIQMSSAIRFQERALMSLKTANESNYIVLSGYPFYLAYKTNLLVTGLVFDSNSTFIISNSFLTLMNCQVTHSLLPAISGTGGEVKLINSVFLDTGMGSSCTVITPKISKLDIVDCTFYTPINSSCLPRNFTSNGNILRVSNFQQAISQAITPPPLMNSGFITYFQQDVFQFQKFPINQAPILFETVMSSATVGPSPTILKRGYELIQIHVNNPSDSETCVKSFKITRSGSIILEIPASILQSCPGVCYDGEFCLGLPILVYNRTNDCMVMGSRAVLDVSLDLNQVYCQRMTPPMLTNPYSVDVETTSNTFELKLNGVKQLPSVALHNITAPNLYSVEDPSGMCLTSITLNRYGTPYKTVTSEDYKRCAAISCGRVFSSTTGCVYVSTFTFDYKQFDCAMFTNVTTLQGCTETSPVLSDELLDELTSHTISKLIITFPANSSNSIIDRTIVLDQSQTLEIYTLNGGDGNFSRLEANFEIYPGANLFLHDLSFAGHITNFGGDVKIDEVDFVQGSQNSNTWMGDGGAILNTHEGILKISSSSFDHLISIGNGGAIANVNSSTATIVGTYFLYNFANGLGNSIFNDYTSSVDLNSCIFAGGRCLHNEEGGVMKVTNIIVRDNLPLFSDSAFDIDNSADLNKTNGLVPNSNLRETACVNNPPFDAQFNSTFSYCQEQCQQTASCSALSYDSKRKTCSLCLNGICRFDCTDNSTFFEASPRFKYFKVSNVCLLELSPNSTLNGNIPKPVKSIEECKSWCGYFTQCSLFTFDETTNDCEMYESGIIETECDNIGGINQDADVYLPFNPKVTQLTFVGQGTLLAENQLITSVSLPSSDKCESFCIRHRRCHAFEFDLVQEICHFYEETQFTNSHGGSLVFINSFRDPFPKQIYGAGFTRFNNSNNASLIDYTFGDCSQRCDRNPFCNAFAYDELNYLCHLLPSLSNEILLPSSSSSSDNFPELNVAYQDINYERVNDTLFYGCPVVPAITNLTLLSPKQCRTICYASESCKMFVYDGALNSCELFAPCFDQQQMIYNDTSQDLFVEAIDSTTTTFFQNFGCIQSLPLSSFDSGVQNIHICERLCDLFGLECVAITYSQQQQECQLLKMIAIVDVPCATPVTYSIALDSIQNPNPFLSIPSQYCLSSPIISSITGPFNGTDCENICSKAPGVCFSYSINSSSGTCNFHKGVNFNLCSSSSQSTYLNSYILYSDYTFSSPDEDQEEIVFTLPVTSLELSMSKCISLCAAYDACNAVQYTFANSSCVLQNSCGPNEYMNGTTVCLSSNIEFSYFLPGVCPSSTNPSETVPCLREEQCMAYCTARENCRGLIFDSFQCKMLFGDIQLTASTATCNVNYFFLDGTYAPLIPFKQLPSSLCSSSTQNSTSFYNQTSAYSCFVQNCYPLQQQCNSFSYDSLKRICVINPDATLSVSCPSSSSSVSSFIVSDFSYTLKNAISFQSPSQMFQNLTWIEDTRACSIMCDRYSPVCVGFALIPECVLYSNLTIQETLDVNSTDFMTTYFPFPQHHLISLGVGTFKLEDTDTLATFPSITQDKSLCLSICELVPNCAAITFSFSTGCSLYESSNYQISETFTDLEIWISFEIQTHYTSANGNFLELKNKGFFQFIAEGRPNWQTQFTSVGPSRLVAADGGVYPWKVSFDGNNNMQIRNGVCLHKCYQQVNTKIDASRTTRVFSNTESRTCNNNPPDGSCYPSGYSGGCDVNECTVSRIDCNSNCCVVCPESLFCHCVRATSGAICCSGLATYVYSCSFSCYSLQQVYQETETAIVYSQSYSDYCQDVNLFGTSSCSAGSDLNFQVQFNPSFTRETSSFFTSSSYQRSGGFQTTSSYGTRSTGIQMMLHWDNYLQFTLDSPYTYEYDYKRVASDMPSYSPDILTICTAAKPPFNPPNYGQDGQLWSTSRTSGILLEPLPNCILSGGIFRTRTCFDDMTFENFRRCELGSDSDFVTYVTFEIRSISANGFCLTYVNGVGVLLQTCSGSDNQQWYVSQNKQLHNLASTRSPIYSQIITWDAEGRIRSGNSALVFPSDLSKTGQFVFCENPAPCYADGHQRFVIPTNYPEHIASNIRTPPQLDTSGYITVPNRDVEFQSETIISPVSLDDCLNRCVEPNCPGVEFDSRSDTCIILPEGGTNKVIQRNDTSNVYIPYSSLPYRRALNGSIDNSAFTGLSFVVAQIVECYALCDAFAECRTVTVEKTFSDSPIISPNLLICRLFDDVPKPDDDYSEESPTTTTTSASSIPMYFNYLRLPRFSYPFDYPERDILVMDGMSTNECSAICHSLTHCQVVGITFLNGKPQCRINTREYTKEMILMTNDQSKCINAQPHVASAALSPASCSNSLPKFIYHYTEQRIQLASEPDVCIVRNQYAAGSNPTIHLGQCTYDSKNPFARENEIFNWRLKEENVFVGAKIDGNKITFENCLLATNPFLSVSVCDQTAPPSSSGSSFRFRKFGQQPIPKYFTKPAALLQSLENPEVMTQLFLLTDNGKIALNLLNQIQNLERSAAPIVDKLNDLGNTIGSVADSATYALAPLSLVGDGVSEILSFLLPVLAMINIVDKVKVVKWVLIITHFDDLLKGISKLMKKANLLLNKLVDKIERLLVPLFSLQGIVLAIAGFLAIFIEAVIVRDLAAMVVKAYACAGLGDGGFLFDSLQAIITDFSVFLGFISEIANNAQALADKTLSTMHSLETILHDRLLPVLNTFYAGIEGIVNVLKEFEFLKDFLNRVILCIPSISLTWENVHVDFSPFGGFDILLPHITLGGKFCLPVGPICYIINAIINALNSIFPGLGNIVGFLRDILQEVLTFILNLLPLGKILGGYFVIDLKKTCTACIVFSESGGQCLTVLDLDRILEDAFNLIDSLFGGVLRFMFDELDNLVKDTLGQLLPEIHLSLPDLDFPDVDLLDGLLDDVNFQYSFLYSQSLSIFTEFPAFFLNKTFIPPDFDLPCGLGDEFNARLDSSLGVGPDLAGAGGLAAAIVAVRSTRGNNARISVSGALSSSIQKNLISPPLKTLTTQDIIPAIFQVFGMQATNKAYKDAYDNDNKKGAPRKPTSAKARNSKENQFKKLLRDGKLDTPFSKVSLSALTVFKTNSLLGRRLDNFAQVNYGGGFQIVTFIPPIVDMKDFKYIINTRFTDLLNQNPGEENTICEFYSSGGLGTKLRNNEFTFRVTMFADDFSFANVPISPNYASVIVTVGLVSERTNLGTPSPDNNLCSTQGKTYRNIPFPTSYQLDGQTKQVVTTKVGIGFSRASAASDSVLASFGPEKIETQAANWEPNRNLYELLDDVSIYYDLAIESLQRAVTYIDGIVTRANLFPDSFAYDELTADTYIGRLFQMLFGIQYKHALEQQLFCGLVSCTLFSVKYSCWSQLDHDDFDEQMKVILSRYRQVLTTLTNARVVNIHSLKAEISKAAFAGKKMIGLTGGSSGRDDNPVVQLNMNYEFMRFVSRAGPTVAKNNACFRRDVSAHLLHEFFHASGSLEGYGSPPDSNYFLKSIYHAQKKFGDLRKFLDSKRPNDKSKRTIVGPFPENADCKNKKTVFDTVTRQLLKNPDSYALFATYMLETHQNCVNNEPLGIDEANKIEF